MSKRLIIKTKNENTYSLAQNSGIILSERGLAKSSIKRRNLLKELDLSVTEKEMKSFTEVEAKETICRYGLTELVLEVTSSCNLRCSYCIFGEKYNELRKHENKNMNFEMAKRAIDQYIELFMSARIYNPSRIPTISFYGGEPLLNFDLIKKCTKYVKSIYKGEIFITLTSNATLLTDEILYFFKEYGITPIFSLDGAEEEHNLHRVMCGNKGTFSTVIKKLNRAYEILEMPLFINTVYSYNTNLNNVINFFVENTKFICLNLAQVSPVNTTYYEDFSDEQIEKFFAGYKLLENEFYDYIKSTDKSFNDKIRKRIYMLDLLFSRKCMNIIVRQLFESNNPASQYTGTCVPGERIFLDVDGYYHPCEKISRSRNIGNISTGLNFSGIAEYMNEFNKEIISSCSSCGIKKMCPVCYNTFLKNGKFIKDGTVCKNNCESFENTFAHYCYLNELDETWLDTFRTDYYKKVKELVVTLR